MINTLFSLNNKTALITGGGGLLGPKHAEAIIECGGQVVLADINEAAAKEKSDYLNYKYSKSCASYVFLDVCDKKSVDTVIDSFDKLDILINNAAKDPKVKKEGSLNNETRFENMSFEYWKDGIDAIINGTFLCSQAAANKMLNHNGGVILNIASDLASIAPDQRIYKKDHLKDDQQPVKPITYSAAKYAVVGMTKYLAVYYAEKNIRVNCLSPTGVYNDHPEDFVKKLSNIIPMNRMAYINEFKGAVAFMCSDASSYMTGHNLIIDGGKTLW
jgi:NAD(P)-dependent dehydrogenase (short-subunit alcohol dehydrogenase family)